MAFIQYSDCRTSHCRATMAGKSCSERRLSKEMASLMKESPPGCTAELKGKNLSEWTATIQGPPGSPYQDGTFILDIIFPRDYPFKPPTVTFRTRIYHCNINSKGKICIDILKEQWSPAMTMDKVLLSVRLLLAAPIHRARWWGQLPSFWCKTRKNMIGRRGSGPRDMP